MARNRLHVFAFLQQKALDGVEDAKEAVRLVQAEFGTESPDGGVTHCGVTREQVRDQFKAMAELVAGVVFPVEKVRLQLDCTEGVVRGDLLEALGQLPLDNPRDVRDLYDLYRNVATQVGEPTLRAGLERLEAAEIDCADLKARVEALYPTPVLEPEEVPGE